ncbi:MAG: PHB depolymerase family esterase [Dehalococcoidia bacterium]
MTASHRTLVLLALLATIVTLAACTGDDDSLDVTGAPTASDTPATPASNPTGVTPSASSPGCRTSADPALGDSDHVMQSGGLQRTYVLHLPPTYDGATPLPLILNLHGFGSNGRQQAAYSRFPVLADSEGFIVVSPDGAGSPQQWNIRRDGNLPDDVAFVRALLDELESELCVDGERLFVAGMSNGAAFAQQLACAMPGRFAAVGAVTALVYPIACASDLPIAVIGFHGTEDVCVPYYGGAVTCGSARGQVRPVEDSAQDWARHNGCNLDPERARPAEHVRTIAYSECDDETAVVLFAIEGGGHTWPGSVAVGRLGATTQEIDATQQIWQFFRGQANLRATSSR